MTRAKRAKRFLVYLLARTAAFLLHLLPVRWAVGLGALGGRIAFFLDRKDRQRAIDQSALALALKEDEARALAKRVFENAGRLAAEIALLGRIRRRFAEYVELPDDAKAVLGGQRGTLFISAHLGSFELLAQRIAHEGYACATFARRSSNPYLAAWLVRMRAAGKVETIERGDPSAPRRILTILKGGGILGALIDQDTRVESVHVPFFGRPAATPVAIADLALRRDLPVVFGWIHRTGRGHRIELERIDLQGLDAAAATAKMTAAIERAIRAAPDEWVWFHARWKTPEPLA